MPDRIHCADELRELHGELAKHVEAFKQAAVVEPLAALEDAATQVGKAWSGSWLGYHSRVYYADLRPPPLGEHFSSEWGFIGRFQGTVGDWKEYEFDTVRAEVTRRAGDPDLGVAREVAAAAEDAFDEYRDRLVSILMSLQLPRQDTFIDNLLEAARETKIFSESDYFRILRPSGTLMSRDSLAMSQGLQAPPHVSILTEVYAPRSVKTACKNVAKLANKAANHVERIGRYQSNAGCSRENVFIGHGNSRFWKDLKDFIQDRLCIPWDEFNRRPVAGVTNVDRLTEMLDSAAFALIVMTAEDQRIDGEMQARMNVIHEAGLFQGRLGFKKAIVMLEEGCVEFSNIHGLVQIRFPKGDISTAFEEVRKVLEREGIIEA